MSRDFDVILWGATGFTGKIAAETLLTNYGNESKKLKWAIAGRSQAKLEDLRKQLFTQNPAAGDLAILTADSDDLASLKKLASQGKVICTTVGPYNQFGKKLLEACVKEKTHYCDLSGETNFIRHSIDKHHEKAVENKVKIVHCCGFDSIPSDLGVLYLQERCQEILGHMCEEVIFIQGEAKGTFSGGTIASLLGVVDEARKDETVRNMLLDPYSLNPPGTKGLDQGDPIDVKYIQDANSWTAPFLMGPINTRIVRRSNALLGAKYGKKFRYQERMALGDGIGGWFAAEGVRAAIGGLVLFGAIPLTRGFLESTILPAPGEGPSKEEQENGYFNITMFGRKKAGDKKPAIRVKIYGRRDPGYGATARMITESAVALALDKLPNQYGVITPAVAFGLKTLSRLEKGGVTFSVE